MMMFEYGIPRPGDEARVGNEWKVIQSYDADMVRFTDGTAALTSLVTEVRLHSLAAAPAKA